MASGAGYSVLSIQKILCSSRGRWVIHLEVLLGLRPAVMLILVYYGSCQVLRMSRLDGREVRQEKRGTTTSNNGWKRCSRRGGHDHGAGWAVAHCGCRRLARGRGRGRDRETGLI